MTHATQDLRPPADGVPLYKQISHDIERRIAHGEWADGARLPSENELVRRFGVSRMTVHRALRELTERGVLSRVKGLGTFVAAPSAQSDLLAIRDIAEDIAARGHAHRAEVLELSALSADPYLAGLFEIKTGAVLFHSVVAHYEDATPIQLEERFINPAFAPDYLKQDFTAVTPTAYLQRVGPATEIEQIIHAARAGAQARDILRIDADQPCLMLTRRTWRDALPATKSVFTLPGNRANLGSRYTMPEMRRLLAR